MQISPSWKEQIMHWLAGGMPMKLSVAWQEQLKINTLGLTPTSVRNYV